MAKKKRVFRFTYVNIKNDKGNLNRIKVNNSSVKSREIFKPVTA
jgi:hypothetical protein